VSATPAGNAGPVSHGENKKKEKAEKAAPRKFNKEALVAEVPLYSQNDAGKSKKLSGELPSLVAIKGNGVACNIFVLAPYSRDKKDDVKTPLIVDVPPRHLSKEEAAPYLEALDVRPKQCGGKSILHISLLVIPVPAEAKPAPPPAPSPTQNY
jgi:hypothetical protein